MELLSIESPAKVNLMLSVHGPRPDGYHALTSVVAPLSFGDRLEVGLTSSRSDRLACDVGDVQTDGSNLILRAADCFRRASGLSLSFDFKLEKRIPVGAGLGGGSSNAAAALKIMNELAGYPLGRRTLLDLAAELGSDCSFFIDAECALVAGRGEQVAVLPEGALERLRGQRVALFRPSFWVSTAWAYANFRELGAGAFEDEAAAGSRIRDYLAGGPLRDLLFNSFEPCVGRKYLAIPSLLEALRAAGHDCLMSGSGSCCFALIESDEQLAALRRTCQRAWGRGVFFVESWLR